MRSKLFNILTVAFALLLGIGVMTFAKACELPQEGDWMSCHRIQMNMVFLAAFLGILSLTSTFIKSRIINLIICIINIGISVLAMLLPGTLMAMCLVEDMRCHSVMKPFVMVVGMLVIIASILSVVISFIRKG